MVIKNQRTITMAAPVPRRMQQAADYNFSKVSKSKFFSSSWKLNGTSHEITSHQSHLTAYARAHMPRTPSSNINSLFPPKNRPMLVVVGKGTEQAERSSIFRFFNSFRLYPFQIRSQAGRHAAPNARCSRWVRQSPAARSLSRLRSFHVKLLFLPFFVLNARTRGRRLLLCYK